MSRWWRLAGGLSMNMALGTRYGWSVFMAPLGHHTDRGDTVRWAARAKARETTGNRTKNLMSSLGQRIRPSTGVGCGGSNDENSAARR